MPRVRIIGLGQPVAGDDGVGVAVIEALGADALPGDVELITARDASELVDLLEGCERAVVVDAAVGGGPPGSVRVLEPSALAALSYSPVSSHGLGVAETLELVRVLSPGAASHVRVVAISIDAPRRYAGELSAPVQAAVCRARDVVLELVLAPPDGGALSAVRA